MDSGQVKSLYLAVRDTVAGLVVHEVRFRKDGKSLLESTQKKPAVLRPDSVLLDETQLPSEDFFRCERIGSKLYLFACVDYFRGLAVPTVACVFDPKSSSSSREQFHDLPTHIPGTSPNIIAAHGRLYHLASTHEKSGVPMPFEVYDPSIKSWDPLPPVPQCPFVPYDKAPRWYMGYAVWGSCILVSLAYPSMNWESLISEPVLFNVESGTWHQLKTEDDPLRPCFPWQDKAVVVGDTAYALGSKMGLIISFSIKKSGSEEDGTLVYSLVRPYMLRGLRVATLPNYLPRQRSCHLLSPLGDFEFCLVQTIDHPISGSQPIWITTFKIIRKEGSRFSKIQTLHSTIEFMKTQDHGTFWPLYCYNPDYEPKELAMLTTIRKQRNKLEVESGEVDCDVMGAKNKEASLTNSSREGNDQKEISSSCRVECSMPLIISNRVSFTNEKADMQVEKTSHCNVEFLKPDFELGRGSATGLNLKGETSPDMVDSNSKDDYEPKESVITGKQARRRRKRKVKHSKQKGSEDSSYIVSLVKHKDIPIHCLVILFIALLYLY